MHTPHARAIGVGIDAEFESLTAPPEPAEKSLAIGLVPEDGTSFVTPVEDVVERVGLLDTQGACHSAQWCQGE